MIRNVIIEYKGVKLKCRGYHTPYKYNGYNEPPDDESFEIDSIYYENVDVTKLFDAFNIDWLELESFCIDNLD